jgi:hypothetical protein
MILNCNPIPWRDSISRPIAPVSLVAGGDDATRTRNFRPMVDCLLWAVFLITEVAQEFEWLHTLHRLHTYIRIKCHICCKSWSSRSGQDWQHKKITYELIKTKMGSDTFGANFYQLFCSKFATTNGLTSDVVRLVKLSMISCSLDFHFLFKYTIWNRQTCLSEN